MFSFTANFLRPATVGPGFQFCHCAEDLSAGLGAASPHVETPRRFLPFRLSPSYSVISTFISVSHPLTVIPPLTLIAQTQPLRLELLLRIIATNSGSVFGTVNAIESDKKKLL